MNDDAVVTVSLKNLAHQKTQLWGAVLGKAHYADLVAELERSAFPSVHRTFVMDFSDIVTTSPSYLKQLLSPLFNSDSQRPQIPLVANLSSDVREDLEVFLNQRGWVLREVEVVGDQARHLSLVGEIEQTALDTLRALEQANEATAADLHQMHKDLRIAQTAWSNRLATLNQLLLAVRDKVGREWIYKPTVET